MVAAAAKQSVAHGLSDGEFSLGGHGFGSLSRALRTQSLEAVYDFLPIAALLASDCIMGWCRIRRNRNSFSAVS